MADPQSDLRDKWLALPEDRQRALLGKMDPEQKANLRDALKAAKQPSAPPVAPPAETRSGWSRAYTAVGEGYKAVPQGTAEVMSDINRALGKPGGLKELQKKYPPTHSIWETLKQSYGSLNPVDVRRTPEGDVDIPATLGATTGRLGAMATMGLVGDPASATPKPEVAPEAETTVGRETLLRKGARALTGTGERQTRKFAEKTVEENKAAEEAAKKATGKQLEAHGEDVAKYEKKVSEVERINKENATQHAKDVIEAKSLNSEAQDQVSRRGALARGIKTLSPRLQSEISAAEKNARQVGNAKYEVVRTKVGDKAIPLDDLVADVESAKSKLKGSQENIKVFSDILSRQVDTDTELGALRRDVTRDQGGTRYEELSPERRSAVDSWVQNIMGNQEVAPTTVQWRDLQGYYTELGKKIADAHGNLPGDVYQALDSLHESIGNKMEKVAQESGALKELKDAQAYWRDYKNTFYDRKTSPVARARKASHPDFIPGQFTGKGGAGGIEALAKYDKQATSTAHAIVRADREMKTLPKKATPKEMPERAAKKPLPEGPPKKPEPVQPEITKIGAPEVQKAKAAAAEKSIDKISNAGAWLLPVSIWEAIRYTATGQIPRAAEVIPSITAFYMTRDAVVRLLDKPEVINWISKPTPADLKILEQLPPEYRSAAATRLDPVVKGAQQKGIKVSPALSAFVAANAAKGESDRKKLLKQGESLASPSQ